MRQQHSTLHETRIAMVRAQKRILRATMGYGDYRLAQRAWARARLAQGRAWVREAGGTV